MLIQSTVNETTKRVISKEIQPPYYAQDFWKTYFRLNEDGSILRISLLGEGEKANFNIGLYQDNDFVRAELLKAKEVSPKVVADAMQKAVQHIEKQLDNLATIPV